MRPDDFPPYVGANRRNLSDRVDYQHIVEVGESLVCDLIALRLLQFFPNPFQPPSHARDGIECH